ncbi:MAG: FAD-binding domain-containing protein [Pseudomonadota bacterium]
MDIERTRLSATRQRALDDAAAFLGNGASRYAKLRNFDFGPAQRQNVSVLSPYIRHRLLLEQEVIAACVQSYGANATSKYIEEVFWRAYFKGWLEHHPSVWQHYQADTANLLRTIEDDNDLLDRYTTAVEGNTGIDCFDAWARELVATGYLHNHARMWFASIWVFTLRLPWQLGADLFLRHLVDGDPASNTLSWRWVSGLHTRGKTYLARVSNILNYTDNRFNPQGQLATHAEPLEETVQHPQEALRLGSAELPDGRYGVLLTEEDCNVESLHPGLAPTAVLGAVATRRRSILPVGQHAHAFAKGAVEDAVERAAAAFSCAGESFEADDWTERLIDWCAKNDLKTLLTPFVPTGPVNDVLTDGAEAIQAAGIRVVMLSRQYDRETWPFASRGYFKLKKQIGSVIERMQLDTVSLSQELRTQTAPQQPDLLRSSG